MFKLREKGFPELNDSFYFLVLDRIGSDLVLTSSHVIMARSNHNA